MPNYRNHTMPYTNYRQMPAPTPAVRRDTSENMVLAMAYVPWQTWQNIYDTDKALSCGTIFQELDLPFQGIGGVKR